MGEAGPEAIMPLARGADGKLGDPRGRRRRRGAGDDEHLDAGRGRLPAVAEPDRRRDEPRDPARAAQSLRSRGDEFPRGEVSGRAVFRLERRAGAADRDRRRCSNGFEERNSPWAHSRRRYDAGLGVRSLDDLAEVVAFFEARHGQLHGFRWKDWTDYKSCLPSAAPVGARPGDRHRRRGAAGASRSRKGYASGAQAYCAADREAGRGHGAGRGGRRDRSPRGRVHVDTPTGHGHVRDRRRPPARW